jgi:hypothetical protein
MWRSEPVYSFLRRRILRQERKDSSSSVSLKRGFKFDNASTTRLKFRINGG